MTSASPASVTLTSFGASFTSFGASTARAAKLGASRARAGSFARAAIALASGAALAACVGACMGKDPYAPGTPLGTFHVVATLQSDACGGAPSPWEFDVKLARDPGTLYWIQGDLPVRGALDAHAHATLSSSATQTIHGADGGLARCDLVRDDALDATLGVDPADPNEVTTLAGTLRYTFHAADGSDCSDQLAFAGGAFAALPCTVAYAIDAHRTKGAGAR